MVKIKENYKFDLGVKGFTMRFHVAMNLFSNISQMASNVLRTKKWQGATGCISMFLPHFECISDLLLYRPMESICFI